MAFPIEFCAIIPGQLMGKRFPSQLELSISDFSAKVLIFSLSVCLLELTGNTVRRDPTNV